MTKRTRREFLGRAVAGAGALALTNPGCRTGPNEAVKEEAGSAPAAVKIPDAIKAFCIDFNWYFRQQEGWVNIFAKPGQWADASAAEHVAWYRALGANVIQTFAVSCNGYAWYKNGFVPPQPGLKDDFLSEVVQRGHEQGMMVAGYFCAGANTKWAMDHPELSYGTPATLHIPYTDEYLDYLGRSIEDALLKTGMDGFMIDWVWNPKDELRKAGWIEAEKKLFTQLTGKPFPKNGQPSAEDKLAYERAAIERCWGRVRDSAKSTKPEAIIWLSCNNLADPTVADSTMLREVDWVMNESPEKALFEAGSKMKGEKGRLIQCLVGWKEHDAKSYLAELKDEKRDLYGFAIPTEDSLPLPVAEYLSKPIEAFEGDDRIAANNRNIAALARVYNGLALDAVVAPKA